MITGSFLAPASPRAGVDTIGTGTGMVVSDRRPIIPAIERRDSLDTVLTAENAVSVWRVSQSRTTCRGERPRDQVADSANRSE